MELLIIKTNSQYIRFKDNQYLSVNLDKASVFPLDHIKTVQGHVKAMKMQGIKDICIKRLVLTEEDFNQ